MNGLEEIRNPVSCTFNKTTGVKKYEYTETQVNAIEKELRDQRKKLTIISEILVDISKGNYSDLKVAIKEIREVL